MRILNFLDDFLDIIRPLWFIIAISILPILLLGFTGQGREIVTILTDSFDQADWSNKMALCATLFYFLPLFSLYLIIMCLVKLRSHFQELTFTLPKLKMSKWIIPVTAIFFPFGLTFLFILLGDHFSKYLLATMTFLSSLLILRYFLNYSTEKLLKKLREASEYKSWPELVKPTSFGNIRFHFPIFVIGLGLIYLFTLYNGPNASFLWLIRVPIMGFLMYLIYKIYTANKSNSDVGMKVFDAVIKKSSQPSQWKNWFQSPMVRWIHASKFFSSLSFFVAMAVLLYAATLVSATFSALLYGYIFLAVALLHVFIYEWRTRKPYGLLIIFVLIGFGLIRNAWNKTTFRTLDQNEFDFSQVQTIQDDLNQRFIEDSSNNDNLVYIIAAEGGGIRSAYWTAGVMFELDSLFPSMADKIYALSGVSGGSVGQMFYYALKHDAQKHRLDVHWKKILGEDYLADVLLGISTGIVVQCAVPYPLTWFDRANILEDDWSSKYDEHTGYSTLDSSIYHLDNEDFHLPNIFFNGTHVERGERVVVSNLKIAREGMPDLMQVIQKPIALKSAALLSARFPGVTPAALIQDKDQKNWGKIVDGGYYDNSGLITARELAEIILKYVPRLKPVIVFIRNSNAEKSQETSISSEIGAPFNAFFKSWTSQTNQLVSDLKKMPGIDFIPISLDYRLDEEEVDYPLGWTLSLKSQQILNQKINGLSQDSLRRVNKANYLAIQKIKALEEEG